MASTSARMGRSRIWSSAAPPRWAAWSSTSRFCSVGHPPHCTDTCVRTTCPPGPRCSDAKLLKVDGKYVVEFGSEDTKTTRGVKYQVAVPESKVDPEVLEPLVDQEVVLGVRPECIHDEPAFLAQATTGVINTTVEVTEMMGAETYLYLNCEGIQLTARVSPRSDVRPQDELKVAIDPNRIHIFDKETEKAVLN